MEEARSKGASEEAFCFFCGYSLRGLDLPHPCPECGEPADPERQAAAARKWFAGWRAWCWWLRRPSGRPAGSWCVLHDRDSVRVARRRGLLWLWVPALLSAAVAVMGTTIVVRYDVTAYHYRASDPKRTPWTRKQFQEDDRLYNRNLRLFRGFGWRDLVLRSPAWLQAFERTKADIFFDPPPRLDAFAAVCAGMPIAWVLLAYSIPQLMVRVLTTRAPVGQTRSAQRRSVRSLTSLVAIPAGLGLWCWLMGLVSKGVGELWGIGELGAVGGWCLFGGAALTLLTGLVGWPWLTADRRLRLVIPGIWVVRVGVLALAVSPVAIMCLVWAFWR